MIELWKSIEDSLMMSTDQQHPQTGGRAAIAGSLMHLGSQVCAMSSQVLDGK